VLTMQRTLEERRRTWRYPVILDVDLIDGKGISRDVCSAGIYFETDATLPTGHVISFSFALEKVYPDVRLELQCTGRIVRVDRRGRRIDVGATIDS
jgi:PilZ domain